MAKVKYFKIERDGIVHVEQWHIMCPGCTNIHAMSPKIHSFNGNFEYPTFSPSLLCNFTPGKTCHSFITNGRIQFLGDCDHALKNQTVELPEID